MSTGLTRISPEKFVRRAMLPAHRLMALVAPAGEVSETKVQLWRALTDLSVDFAENDLERVLREPRRGRRGTVTVIVMSTFSVNHEQLWREAERLRSRLQDGPPTMFLLDEDDAKALQRIAPNLESTFGMLWGADLGSRDDSVLKSAIATARGCWFPGLYESGDDRSAGDVEQVTRAVIAGLGDPLLDDVAWRRVVSLGRSGLAEVLPTIAAHWPERLDDATRVAATIDQWLALPTPPLLSREHDDPAPRAPQALSEAMAVVGSAWRLMIRTSAASAAADIFDLIFEGYAVIPGSAGRRALFDWWLNEAVPAAEQLRRPHPLDPAVRSARASTSTQ